MGLQNYLYNGSITKIELHVSLIQEVLMSAISLNTRNLTLQTGLEPLGFVIMLERSS